MNGERGKKFPSKFKTEINIDRLGLNILGIFFVMIVSIK